MFQNHENYAKCRRLLSTNCKLSGSPGPAPIGPPRGSNLYGVGVMELDVHLHVPCALCIFGTRDDRLLSPVLALLALLDESASLPSRYFAFAIPVAKQSLASAFELPSPESPYLFSSIPRPQLWPYLRPPSFACHRRHLHETLATSA